MEGEEEVGVIAVEEDGGVEEEASRCVKRVKWNDAGGDFSEIMHLLPKLHHQMSELTAKLHRNDVQHVARCVKEKEADTARLESRKGFEVALKAADVRARMAGSMSPTKVMHFFQFTDLVVPGDSFTGMYLRGKLNSIWQKTQGASGGVEFLPIVMPVMDADEVVEEVIDLTASDEEDEEDEE
jgi:hypothetical protein